MDSVSSTDQNTANSNSSKRVEKRGDGLGELVRRFLEYCEIEKGRSALTVRNYRHYLDRFLEFTKSHSLTDPAQIDQEVIHKYRLFLNRYSTESPLGKATQNYHLIALRSWLKYLSKRDIPSLAPEKIDLAATPDRQINFLTLEEVKRLIQAVPASGLIGWRDRAILAFLFSTGLRVAELTGLNRQAVNIETAELQI
ncbi:MAG: putative Tyrosine recombinase xerD, partial [Candidatus Berkelbacteria bacterium Gr01-1014_85]